VTAGQRSLQRAQRLWLFVALAILTLPIEIVARHLGAPGVLISFRTNFFTQFAFASLALVYGLKEHDRRRRDSLIASGTVVTLAGAVTIQAHTVSPVAMVHIWLLALGAIGLLQFAYAALHDTGMRDAWQREMPAALIVVLGVALAPFCLWLSNRINPVEDLYILAFEDTLGIRPSIFGVRLFNAFPLFGLVCAICYIALPLGIVVLQALQTEKRTETDVVVAFVAVSAIGYSLYFLFPVVGPLTAFGSAYPDHLPAIGTVRGGEIVAPSNAPRNGLPSLHAAWAMLIWMNARILDPIWRRLLRTFAAGNLLATMGLPDTHWLTDIVVSLPLTIGIQALCNIRLPLASRTRWGVVLGCATLFGAWLAILWWGQAAFVAAALMGWLPSVATLAACWLMDRAVVRSTAGRTAALASIPVLSRASDRGVSNDYPQ
jgi:hypothetical protein